MCCGQIRKPVDSSKQVVTTSVGAPPRPLPAQPRPGTGRDGRAAPVNFVK